MYSILNVTEKDLYHGKHLMHCQGVNQPEAIDRNQFRCHASRSRQKN